MRWRRRRRRSERASERACVSACVPACLRTCVRASSHDSDRDKARCSILAASTEVHERGEDGPWKWECDICHPCCPSWEQAPLLSLTHSHDRPWSHSANAPLRSPCRRPNLHRVITHPASHTSHRAPPYTCSSATADLSGTRRTRVVACQQHPSSSQPTQ